jgi:hypothetical protein
MNTMSPEEARRKYEEALAALPPDVQETMRSLIANARPQPRIDTLSRPAVTALAREDIDSAVVELIDRTLSASIDRTKAVQELPRGVQIFYLSFIVEAEVMNGGFNQFFWNSSSEYAELIAPALRELQAPRAAEIFEQAFLVARAEIEKQAKARSIGTLEAFSETYKETRLNEFDEIFCTEAEHFPSLRMQVVQTNEPVFFASQHEA